jgi:hypothetical protein
MTFLGSPNDIEPLYKNVQCQLLSLNNLITEELHVKNKEIVRSIAGNMTLDLCWYRYTTNCTFIILLLHISSSDEGKGIS